jgi:NADH-quinone oxidoreductase subunit C
MSDETPDQSAAEIAKSTIPVGPGDGVVSEPKHGMFGVAGSGDTSGFGGLVRDRWIAPGAERPYGSYFDEVVDNLTVVYPDFEKAVSKIVVDRGELTIHVEREHLLGIAESLRNDRSLRFELLSSVSGVDYYDASTPDSKRLHAVYHLTSMTYRRRLRLEVAVTADDPHVPSVTALYPTADWQEREAWDMFGIVFDGHPALTRILMPDDWSGFPQRKDYPLGGIHVQYKGATIPPPDERRAYK